jgi:hypothetical protein
LPHLIDTLLACLHRAAVHPLLLRPSMIESVLCSVYR